MSRSMAKAFRMAVFCLAIALPGCGLARQHELRAKIADLQAQNAAAVADCDARIPKGNAATAVARSQCINDANMILRPIMPYPDLWDQLLATNLAIAERVQNKQITILQANEMLAQKRSEIVAEEQRRSLARRSVGAQEAIASASVEAAGPRTCTRIGNSVTCF